jgi:hypothetical protein
LRRRPSEEPAILEPPAADRVVGDVLTQTVSPDGELEVAGHDAAFDALAEDADARMLQDELRLRLEQDRGVLRRYAELLDPEPPGAGPMVGAERPPDDIEAEFWAGPAGARPRRFGRRQSAEIVLEGSGTEAIDLTAYEPAPHAD